jgi:hypothetical protein
MHLHEKGTAKMYSLQVDAQPDLRDNPSNAERPQNDYGTRTVPSPQIGVTFHKMASFHPPGHNGIS